MQFKIWCVCVWVLQSEHSGDGCDLVSTLCKYDLRKGDIFVLSWARVRRVRRGSISSELLMCGGSVCSILLLPLVTRCIETIDACIWCMFVQMKESARNDSFADASLGAEVRLMVREGCFPMRGSARMPWNYDDYRCACGLVETEMHVVFLY